MTETLSYGGNISRSCGFKTSPDIVPRQTRQKLTRKQKTGEGPASDTESFSRPSVKYIASTQHGSSGISTRLDLFGGRLCSTTHDMLTQHTTRPSLQNLSLEEEFVESTIDYRFYKGSVEREVSEREVGL